MKRARTMVLSRRGLVCRKDLRLFFFFFKEKNAFDSRKCLKPRVLIMVDPISEPPECLLSPIVFRECMKVTDLMKRKTIHK